MVDQSETPKILDEIAKKTSRKSSRPKGKGRAGFVFLLLLTLSVTAGVAYLGYQLWLLTEDVNQLRADNGELSGSMTDLMEQANRLATDYQAMSAALANIDADQLSTEYTQLGVRINQLAEENAQLKTDMENQSSSVEVLQSQNARLQQIQNQLAQADPEIVIDNTGVAEVEQRLNSRISQLNTQISQMQQLVQLQQSSGTEAHFYLLEAEHLLRISNQKLQLDNDLPGALSVLQSVAELLADNGESDSELGQRLDQDRLALSSAEAVDLEGLYHRVDQLLARFNTLMLANSLSQSLPDLQPVNASGPSVPSTASNLEPAGFWSSSMEFLNSVFVWRRWEETPDAMLPVVQDSFTKQNLYLWLEHAKLALLTRNQERFLESIENCEAWLSYYMIADDEASQSVMAELQALSLINIRPELPNVSGSLALVRQLIEQSSL